MIWYAGYGSNLSRDRFACYVEGGTPPGAGRTYAGCRDRTPPRDTTALTVPRPARLRAASPRVWGGGHGLPRPRRRRRGAWPAAYLVTEEQLADVAEQEPRYDAQTVVAEHDGLPVVALTRSDAPRAGRARRGVPAHDPRRPDRRRPDARAAIDYLLAAPTASTCCWDDASIRALLEQPADARG